MAWIGACERCGKPRYSLRSLLCVACRPKPKRKCQMATVVDAIARSQRTVNRHGVEVLNEVVDIEDEIEEKARRIAEYEQQVHAWEKQETPHEQRVLHPPEPAAPSPRILRATDEEEQW